VLRSGAPLLPKCTMPTNKPRMTITLEPKVYAALKAFSDGTGQPMSQFITQVMEQALPALERLALIVQQAKRAKPEAMDQIRANLTKIDRVAHRAYGSMETAFDLFAEPPAAAATRHRRARRPAAESAPGPVSPPISNRGGQKPSEGVSSSPGKPRGGGAKVVRLRGRR
jgi:predicted DNA-binding protein